MVKITFDSAEGVSVNLLEELRGYQADPSVAGIRVVGAFEAVITFDDGGTGVVYRSSGGLWSFGGGHFSSLCE